MTMTDHELDQIDEAARLVSKGGFVMLAPETVQAMTTELRDLRAGMERIAALAQLDPEVVRETVVGLVTASGRLRALAKERHPSHPRPLAQGGTVSGRPYIVGENGRDDFRAPAPEPPTPYDGWLNLDLTETGADPNNSLGLS